MNLFSSKNRIRVGNNFLLEEKDILSDLTGDKGSALFLGRYSLNEVSAVLKKRNFFRDALKRKLWPLVFHMDTSDYPLQRFQVFYRERKPENLIVDLKIREATFQPRKELSPEISLPRLRFLILDWLTLQNPLLSFSDERELLPGQKHPGLNLGRKVLDVFVYLARLSQLDGILAFPAFFHNALLFSRYFSFLNPRKQAEIQAIRKAFPRVPFKSLAWIVHLECLRERDGKVYKWEAEEQVYPLHEALKSYFHSRAYQRQLRENLAKFEFTVDWECYRAKRHDQEQDG